MLKASFGGPTRGDLQRNPARASLGTFNSDFVPNEHRSSAPQHQHVAPAIGTPLPIEPHTVRPWQAPLDPYANGMRFAYTKPLSAQHVATGTVFKERLEGPISYVLFIFDFCTNPTAIPRSDFDRDLAPLAHNQPQPRCRRQCSAWPNNELRF